MNAKDLVAILLDTPDAEVMTYDPDADDYVPVTGVLVDADQKSITLQTDD